ncbi:MAG: hypothetical protein QW379_00610 [Thermoplasmata archaeon]
MLRVAGAVLAIASAAVILIAALLPWAALNVDTRLGPVPVSLRAEVFEYGVSYEANLEGAGLIGGGAVPSKIKDSKVFLTGLGDFQETIGFVKGTVKEKVNYVTSYTWPPPQNGTAETRLTTFVRTIPWWPVGIEQEAGVRVELLSASNVSELVIERVWLELRRTEGGRELSRVVWSASPSDALRRPGDGRSYSAGVAVDGDYGEFRLVAGVHLHLRDSFNNSNRLGEGVYRELASPPRNITLWTMGTSTTLRIGLMLIALPLSVAAAALVAASIAPLYLKKRWAWKLCAAGSALALLAVVFYVLGVQALIELTGYGRWFSWSPAFWLAAAGSVLTIPPAALLFVTRAAGAEKTGIGREGAERGEKNSHGAKGGPGDAPAGMKRDGAEGDARREEGRGGRAGREGGKGG